MTESGRLYPGAVEPVRIAFFLRGGASQIGARRRGVLASQNALKLGQEPASSCLYAQVDRARHGLRLGGPVEIRVCWGRRCRFSPHRGASVPKRRSGPSKLESAFSATGALASSRLNGMREDFSGPAGGRYLAIHRELLID
jgi:hypothetical protein